MAPIIPGIVLIYKVESTPAAWTLHVQPSSEFPVPVLEGGPDGATASASPPASPPPAPPASPRATCCGGPSAAVPSPAPARGSHIDCILHFLLWGRGESTLTRDQRVETLLNFCEVELDFEVLLCGLVIQKLTLSNRLRVLSANEEKGNLLLREAIFFCYELLYIYSKIRL